MSSNLDKLFKEALQEQVCEPPVRVWKGIESHLNKRHRRIGAWWWQGIAAIAILVLGISLWQLLQTEENIQVAELVPTDIPIIKTEQPVATKEQALEPKDKVEEIQHVVPLSVKYAENTLGQERILPAHFYPSGTVLLVAENTMPAVKDLKRDFIPLTSRDAIRNQETYLSLLNEKPVVKEEKERAKITVSGHFVPAFSSGNYSSSVKNTRGFSYSNNQMSGLMNAGGGMKISVASSKRLSFQTGIFYSRMGQRSTENQNTPRTAAFSTDKQTPRMTTPLGNVKTNRKAVSYRTSEAIVLNSMGESDETLEQVFGSVEIPVHVRYRLNNNKMLFSLTGGLSGGFIVSNKVFLESSGQRELLGSTEEIRTFNLSTDVGLGMEYPISKNIKVMLEPGFRYFLQSISRNELINFKPYTFTLSTGIGIEF